MAEVPSGARPAPRPHAPVATIMKCEQALMGFSEEVGDRYFLQAGGAPTTKLATLA